MDSFICIASSDGICLITSLVDLSTTLITCSPLFSSTEKIRSELNIRWSLSEIILNSSLFNFDSAEPTSLIDFASVADTAFFDGIETATTGFDPSSLRAGILLFPILLISTTTSLPSLPHGQNHQQESILQTKIIVHRKNLTFPAAFYL